jgi:hypothetical protein
MNRIEDAKAKYHQYFETQKDFQAPQAQIDIDVDSNDVAHVHMAIEYNGTQCSLRSIQEKDIDDMYQHLSSQALVRAKYADGKTTSLEATTARVKTFTSRFRNKNSPTYLYSGFVVTDSQTDTFLGVVNLGVGIEAGTTEMAIMNRVECWSHPPGVGSSDNGIGTKVYTGIGTAETCALVQYAAQLKQRGYYINGHPLKAVVAFARVDNEGSWKSSAKAGLTLNCVEVLSHFGSDLRYRLRKEM